MWVKMPLGGYKKNLSQNNINKTQYDWFPGKSQNSKKFSSKFKQNPTTSKNHRVFLNILGGLKYPQTVTTNFGGQNNINKRAMLGSLGGGQINNRKMNSATSNYSKCKFSAKSNNF